jgi:hypothetical protein
VAVPNLPNFVYQFNVETLYLGILNPRTDPLVRTFDTIRDQQNEISSVDSSMKFYSTAEYDIGIRQGNYTHIWNPGLGSYEWRDSTCWQNLWWKRQGCREISIRFLIPQTIYPTVKGLYYYSMKIEELGAQNTNLNSEFWRDPRFYHKVDTFIVNYRKFDNFLKGSGIAHGEYTLNVRLLPGEGKILRVTIFRNYLPDFLTRGDLNYASQIKTITIPCLYIIRQVRDTMYRHMVYHRRDSISGRSKVYYRKSYPIVFDTIKSIGWSPEICLSDSIRCWRDPYQIITNADCAYPSLVVRYDSVLERTRVFVTFVCLAADSLSNFNDCFYSYQARDNCSNLNYSVVAECVFNADDTVQVIPPAQAIHWACGGDYTRWGVPVINASRYGNYYAWADSLYGLVTAYKRPELTEFPIGFNFSMSSFRFYPNGFAFNPSVPAYSRIFYDEDGAPIVWQEKLTPYTLPNVYYSLLKADTSGMFVRHYLPSGIGDNNPSFVFNADTSIVKIGFDTEIAENPVIYRDVKDSLQPPRTTANARSCRLGQPAHRYRSKLSIRSHNYFAAFRRQSTNCCD